MALQERFRTGVRNTTVPNPALMSELSGAQVYSGLASQYDFLKQKENHQRLRACLQRAGLDFTLAHAVTFQSDTGWCYENSIRCHRFVVETTDPGVLWYKYVAGHPGSGQNHLFVHGRRIKVSQFVSTNEYWRLEESVQVALLTNNRQLLELLAANGQRVPKGDDQLWC